MAHGMPARRLVTDTSSGRADACKVSMSFAPLRVSALAARKLSTDPCPWNRAVFADGGQFAVALVIGGEERCQVAIFLKIIGAVLAKTALCERVAIQAKRKSVFKRHHKPCVAVVGYKLVGHVIVS